MHDSKSRPVGPECVARVCDINRQTNNRLQEIFGLKIRYKDNYDVLPVLEAATRLTIKSGEEEIRAAYMEDYHVREEMSFDDQDLARALVVEPERNLANLYRKTRDSLLGSVLNIEVKIDEAITPRRIR